MTDNNAAAEHGKPAKIRPYGALRPIVKKFAIKIIRDRCKGCGFCVEFCPRRVLVMSQDMNDKGYHPPAVADLERCVDCGLCEAVCPEFSIYVPPEE